ncbi:MAG: hypothetical protein ACSLFP_18100 [Acidimicrobiales bacterium]
MRSHPSSPSATDRLAAVAKLVDDTCSGEQGHVLVHLADATDEHVDLGLRPLPRDRHPFGEVAGFEAPSEWWAFGMRVRGRARHLDRPGGVKWRTAVTYLLSRDGDEVSLERAGPRTTPLPGPAVGTIPDLCRRVLGLPTDPPPPSTAVLWTCVWLDRVLDTFGQPERRRELMASWSAVAALHPAAEGTPPTTVEALVDAAHQHAAAHSWTHLRQRPEPLPLPGGSLPPDIAAWMDDGFFARWAIGAYPPLGTLANDLGALLGPDLGPQLRRCTLGLLGHHDAAV